MDRRLPLWVLLASSLTFLVSLFLPWRETTTPPFTSQGVLTLLTGGSVEGWVSIAGDVAVLIVISIVLTTMAALLRPRLAPRLPIASLGVALGYFAVAVAVEVHTLSAEFHGGFTGRPHPPHASWAYGFYLGLASAGIAVLSGLAVRRSKLLRLPGAGDYLADVLGIALLVSFLLPWLGVRGAAGVGASTHGIEIAAVAIAALVLILGGRALHGEARRGLRLPAALAVAILTGGAASAVPFSYEHLYGTWIGVGFAVALVALEAVRAWPARLPAFPLPAGTTTVRTAAAAFLIVALFLPWEEFHLAGTSGHGTNGWYSAVGAAAGSLSLLLLATPAIPALDNYVLDTVVAVVIFVSVAGTAFRQDSFVYRAGYGAYVGFAAAGILLVTAFVPLRPGHVDRRRALWRAVPLVASVLCIAAVVMPLWFVLPERWDFQASALYGAFTVPGVLLALYLIRLWGGRVRGPANTGRQLTFVPLVLLTLASLELIRFRNGDVIWGAVILVGLSLLLALCGWIEEDSGVASFRVPDEIWRVDRLPDAEG